MKTQDKLKYQLDGPNKGECILLIAFINSDIMIAT